MFHRAARHARVPRLQQTTPPIEVVDDAPVATAPAAAGLLAIPRNCG